MPTPDEVMAAFRNSLSPEEFERIVGADEIKRIASGGPLLHTDPEVARLAAGHRMSTPDDPEILRLVAGLPVATPDDAEIIRLSNKAAGLDPSDDAEIERLGKL